MRIKIRPSHRHASIVAGKTRKPFCGVPLIPALSRAIFSGKETREANLLAFRGSVGIMEESIFQPYLGTRTIFKMDREILRPSYLPDRLPHRENHIGQLAQILETALKGERPGNVLIFATTGTGKTAADTLAHLEKINDDLPRARVSLIGIWTELPFTEFPNPRAPSRLADEKMVFPPYNADELYDILAERSRLAFENGTAADGVLQLIAALAAQEHGDARRALDLLRVSAELAERQGEEHITEEHVQRAKNKIQASVPALDVKKVLEKDEILAEARGYRLKVQTTLL